MQRQKWRTYPASPQVNDLVLILEEPSDPCDHGTALRRRWHREIRQDPDVDQWRISSSSNRPLSVMDVEGGPDSKKSFNEVP
ncbi:hypothetical protein T12_4124 [Trichinella patagoniensis]|uniref:DUF5641 domain-containing protein n=1 Tax=Trichinella patagoniensis TaxID=990121 RepID=A0A0V0Z8M1_9BILA|nr:hypothetical protein T12_8989 [Trichinella patagoniensis]KRY20379.1 hypothetical protein T12_4124 [Trichinella patagoniensis]